MRSIPGFHVNHQILLKTLEAYGIRGLPLNCFSSYLTNRQQYVTLESPKQTMVCGIPQGSSLGPLLFLIYINDISNCSDKVSIRIFADDTNIFASSKSIKDLEILINEEKVKKWCDLNKLSINIKKTNYMIVKSSNKKITENININITNKDGTIYCLERKDHIKYLGMLIDEELSWKYHIAYICSRLARNIGIFYKLRYYMTLAQLKQLYYSLIYSYISYAILAWGSTYKTQIKKVQIKQNTVIRVIFFAITYGQNTESAFPFMRLLDILDVESLYKLQILKFAYLWQRNELPDIFHDYFQFACDVHSYNTRYATRKNFYKPRTRTNIGKQSVSSIAVDLWQELPCHLKDLPHFSFSRKVK